LPVWLGLSLAIPIVWLTALREAGQMARRAGLLLVAGEMERPDPAVPEVRCAEPGRAGRLNPVG
jgi:membrane glycosyltransferase